MVLISIRNFFSIIQGEPKPSMTWSFNKDGSDKYEDLKNAQYFYYIDEINEHHSGIYRCEAINKINRDFHEMQLVVKRMYFNLNVNI